MNKKFFTLAAAILAAGSVSAQFSPEPVINHNGKNWFTTNETVAQGSYRTFQTLSGADLNGPVPTLPGKENVENDAFRGTLVETADRFYGGLNEYGTRLRTGAQFEREVHDIDPNHYFQIEAQLPAEFQGWDPANAAAAKDFATTGVLVQERDYETGELYLRVLPKSQAPLNASLWRINFGNHVDASGGGDFTFENKETGVGISFDESIIGENNDELLTEVRAGHASWEWYPSHVIGTNAPFEYASIYSTVHDADHYEGQMMYLAYADKDDLVYNSELNEKKVARRDRDDSTTRYLDEDTIFGGIDATVLDLEMRMTGNGDMDPTVKEHGFDIAQSVDNSLSQYVMAVTVPTEGNITSIEKGMAPVDGVTGFPEPIKFRPVYANPILMRPGHFNTRMDADMKTDEGGFTFANKPSNLKGDVMTGSRFTASYAATGITTADRFGETSATYAGDVFQHDHDYQTYRWVSGETPTKVYSTTMDVADQNTDVYGYFLSFKDKDGKYLIVDTARHRETEQSSTSSASVMLGLSEIDVNTTINDATPMYYYYARAIFRAVYFPSNDSIALEPLNASVMGDEYYDDMASGRGSWGEWIEDMVPGADATTYTYGRAFTTRDNDDRQASNTYFNFESNSGTIPTFDISHDVTNAEGYYNNDIDDTNEEWHAKFPWLKEGANEDHGISLTSDDLYGDKALSVTRYSKYEFGVRTTIERPFETLTRTTLEDGLYYIQLGNKDAVKEQREYKDYLVKNLSGQIMYDEPEDNQNYDYMPATMWQIRQLGCEHLTEEEEGKRYVEIRNREYPRLSFIGQLYSEDGVHYRFINRKPLYDSVYNNDQGLVFPFESAYFEYEEANNPEDLPYKFTPFTVHDQLMFTLVTAPEAKTETHGYEWLERDSLHDAYENNYYIRVNDDFDVSNDLGALYLVSNGLDKTVTVERENRNTYFEIAEATVPIDEEIHDKGATEYSFGLAFSGNEWKPGCNDDDPKAVISKYTDLKRKAYVLKVKDTNQIDNDRQYLARVKRGGQAHDEYKYEIVHEDSLNNTTHKLGVFYLKHDEIREDADGNITKAYIMIDINKPNDVVIKGLGEKVFLDGNANLQSDNGWRSLTIESHSNEIENNELDNEPDREEDTFFQEATKVLQYVNLENDYKISTGDRIRIFRESIYGVPTYLYEDGMDNHTVAEPGRDYNKEFSYLGYESKGFAKDDSAAFYVNSIVNDYELMPRYLFGVRVDSVKDGYICDKHGREFFLNLGDDDNEDHGYWDNEDSANEDDHAHHGAYNGYVIGSWITNLTDSVGDETTKVENADLYKLNNYTRLGFVKGIHQVGHATEVTEMSDTTIENFYVLRENKGYTWDSVLIVPNLTLKGTENYKKVVLPVDLGSKYFDIHNLSDSMLNNNFHTFSLRKFADPVGTTTKSEQFFMESVNNKMADFRNGEWVKIHNEVPVLTNYSYENEQHETNTSGEADIQEVINQGGLFRFELTELEAVSNEEVAETVSTVAVVAVEGGVQVMNAAGKTVTVANVLGQVVASTVVSSDNATVTVPAGIVIVSVEGEEATKVLVK